MGLAKFISSENYNITMHDNIIVIIKSLVDKAINKLITSMVLRNSKSYNYIILNILQKLMLPKEQSFLFHLSDTQ